MTKIFSWEEAVRQLIDDPSQEELVRDCYFDQPLKVAVERYLASREWQAVRTLLGPGGKRRALDVGAGNGIVSYALAKDGWQVTALEPDPSDLVGRGAITSLTKSLGVVIEAIDSVGESIPAEDGSFDLVIARQVFHHALDLDAFCREMARVLKPGGKFFSFRDHVVDNEKQRQAFFEIHALHRLYGGENAYSEARYAAAIEQASLKIIRRWRHFEAEFNFAPKNSIGVANEVARRLSSGQLGSLLARILAFPPIFSRFSHALSVVDRRPGRLIAFLAERAPT